MIIYIYQGMMALGKGGNPSWESREGENAGRGGWGKKYKKKLGSNKCSSKGGTNRIFTNIFHFQGGTDDIGGARIPSLLLNSSPSLPTTCTLMPHGSLFHMSLGPTLSCIPGLVGIGPYVSGPGCLISETIATNINGL